MTLSIALFVLILGIIFISLLTFCLQIVYKIISLQKGKGRKCKRSASLSLNRYLVLLLNSLLLVCDLSLFHHYIKNINLNTINIIAGRKEFSLLSLLSKGPKSTKRKKKVKKVDLDSSIIIGNAENRNIILDQPNEFPNFVSNDQKKGFFLST